MSGMATSIERRSRRGYFLLILTPSNISSGPSRFSGLSLRVWNTWPCISDWPELSCQPQSPGRLWNSSTQLGSANDEPGHEVLLLTSIQVHNKWYSEYHIPVLIIKRLESIAWHKLIDTFPKYNWSRQNLESWQNPRSCLNLQASQPGSNTSWQFSRSD
jgi:hypothetical protein